MRIAWAGDGQWTAEVCELDFADGGLVAAGTQLGADPHPYRATYLLDARGDWITRRFQVRVDGAELDLRHDGSGHWDARPDLDGALDCDLAYSPLTNLMPIRRHALHERAGAHEFLMAWVSLPDLSVHLSPQRYEHVRPGVVRFDGEGFTAEIEVDATGVVIAYPEIARRVAILAP